MLDEDALHETRLEPTMAAVDAAPLEELHAAQFHEPPSLRVVAFLRTVSSTGDGEWKVDVNFLVLFRLPGSSLLKWDCPAMSRCS